MSQADVDPIISISKIRTRMSGLTAEEMKALQDIYHDRWRRNWLRANGWLNLFLGGLTIWLGLYGLPELTFLKLIQTLAGVVILTQSLWSLVAQSNAAILRFAILFLGIGIWNLLVAIVSDFPGSAALTGLLGIAQLWWAFQAYREYQRYQKMDLSETRTDLAQLYDEMWRSITKRIFKADPGSIAVWVGGKLWRGLLVDDRVIFAFKGRKLLIVQSKGDASFVPNSSNAMRKRRVYGRIKLNSVSERAMMKRESFEKYASWKGEEAVLAEITPTLWQRLPRAIQIALLIVGGMILLYVAFMVIVVIGAFIQYG